MVSTSVELLSSALRATVFARAMVFAGRDGVCWCLQDGAWVLAGRCEKLLVVFRGFLGWLLGFWIWLVGFVRALELDSVPEKEFTLCCSTGWIVAYRLTAYACMQMTVLNCAVDSVLEHGF